MNEGLRQEGLRQEWICRVVRDGTTPWKAPQYRALDIVPQDVADGERPWRVVDVVGMEIPLAAQIELHFQGATTRVIHRACDECDKGFFTMGKFILCPVLCAECK